jgi:hypothetical protein
MSAGFNPVARAVRGPGGSPIRSQVVAADELAGAVSARAKRWSRRPAAKSYATYLNSQCLPEGYLAYDLL